MIIQVAIPNTPFDYLDYSLKTELKNLTLLGARVRVPFRNKSVVGIITATNVTSNFPLEKLKTVEEVLDETPIFNQQNLNFITWISHYYQSTLGELLTHVIPARLKHGKEFKFSTRYPLIKNKQEPENHLILNKEQSEALYAILEKLSCFQTFLLHGVTGSGKTEVYLQVCQKILDQKKQVLILVPEIGLTPQLVSRFQKRFKQAIASIHSGLNDSERLNAWYSAYHQQAQIIIGTRSAIFAPIPNLGLIIVDEEHDLSFKQQDGTRYNAKDAAIKLAQMRNIPIILGSATPAIETLHNAYQKKYTHLYLTNRAKSKKKSVVKLIDMRSQKIIHGISQELVTNINSHLNRNEQVLVFINRRGFSPVLLCGDCNFIIHCKFCSANLTLHFKSNLLKCHHCGYQQRVIKECQDCGSNNLLNVGAGSERIEENLNKLFPNANILRIDRDTTRAKNELENKLKLIHDKKVNLLVGTQMIAKGHHFPNLTLVAMINIDQGFFSQDFRAAERTGQLIVQVAGRAGREHKAGKVLIQTLTPNHPLLLSLLKNGYEKFSQQILLERKQSLFPPYSFMTLFRCRAKQFNNASDPLSMVKEFIINNFANDSLMTLGPAPAPIEKKANYFQMQLLLINSSRANLSSILKATREFISQKVNLRSCHFSIDVDPKDLS